MQVRITNVTDGPGKKPAEVRVYTKRLRPGAFMDVPVQFVDDKVRKLEQAGVIVIGPLPPWYADYSARRKVKNLTPSEVAANVQAKKDFTTRKAAPEVKEEPPATSDVSPETVVIDPVDASRDIEHWDVTDQTRDIRSKNRPKR